jgi:hypothetical protein
MARNLPPGEERSALLKMAEEWDRLVSSADPLFAAEVIAATSPRGLPP